MAAFALTPAASAHHPSAASEVAAAAPSSCGGAADPTLMPHRVITGEFDTSLEGSYVLVPFMVPQDTTAVRVRYCHDQPDAPTNARIKHVLDLGLYDARPLPGALWGEGEFRGWGGSSHPDVTVSANGFSSESQYLASPRLHRQGRTTRGFEPGPIPVGEWAVELGVAAIASQLEGDADGKVAWRVEIDISSNPLWESDPYSPYPYDETPARPGPGWYAGDFHVHGEHSSLGDATMREIFDFAFAPLERDCGVGCERSGAGLDFITLSDYVTTTGWGEIGRYQPDYPGRLVMRSAEVITYRGHHNNHASATYVDYRTGPVLEQSSEGTLTTLRAARPPSQQFDAVHSAGGFTQINHPTIFPSEVPGFDFLCRGCPWDYSDEETAYSKVDAVEVATGPAGLKEDPEPGPNPFTPTAIKFWEDAIDAGGPNSSKIAAVGSSDSHNAGRTPDPVTQSPIGQATTVVYAQELSERGIEAGVQARHTYVKIFGNDGPDLRFEATAPGSGDPPAIMGDTLAAPSAEFTARVMGAGPGAARPGDYELFVLRDGAPFLAVPITSDDFSFTFPSVGAARYRLQVQRDSAIEAVSSPIWLEGSGGGYPRPQGAVNLRVPLTIAYDRCDPPGNSTHGPALSHPSCSPPQSSSPSLTAGTPDANDADPRANLALRMTVLPGDPQTAGDQADVRLALDATDVRERAGLLDYAGELTARAVLRITDRSSSVDPASEPFDQAATVIDVPFSFTASCSPSSDQEIGSSCATVTSADAVVPGAAVEGKRAIWEVGQVELLDGGPDGFASTEPNSVFARQGVFIP